MPDIVTDENFLREYIKETPINDLETIKDLLLKTLSKTEHGIGLSANQIGIKKRVCLIWSDRFHSGEPMFLINPVVIELDERGVTFQEQCLSFPGRTVITKRSIWVTVTTDNFGTVMFGPLADPTVDVIGTVQSVVVQHEIDHLDGITMFDRQVKL